MKADVLRAVDVINKTRPRSKIGHPIFDQKTFVTAAEWKQKQHERDLKEWRKKNRRYVVIKFLKKLGMFFKGLYKSSTSKETEK